MKKNYRYGLQELGAGRAVGEQRPVREAHVDRLEGGAVLGQELLRVHEARLRARLRAVRPLE